MGRTPRSSHRALSERERQEVLDLLHGERFVDQAPAQVAAALLDDERYLCSVRTMYRILDANHEVRERRNQLVPSKQRPGSQLADTGNGPLWPDRTDSGNDASRLWIELARNIQSASSA